MHANFSPLFFFLFLSVHRVLHLRKIQYRVAFVKNVNRSIAQYSYRCPCFILIFTVQLSVDLFTYRFCCLVIGCFVLLSVVWFCYGLFCLVIGFVKFSVVLFRYGFCCLVIGCFAQLSVLLFSHRLFCFVFLRFGFCCLVIGILRLVIRCFVQLSVSSLSYPLLFSYRLFCFVIGCFAQLSFFYRSTSSFSLFVGFVSLFWLFLLLLIRLLHLPFLPFASLISSFCFVPRQSVASVTSLRFALFVFRFTSVASLSSSLPLSLVCFNYLLCYYFIYFTFVCSLHLPLFHLHYLALICLPFFSFASLSFSSVLLTCLLVYSSYFFLHLKAKILFILCILGYPPFLLHYFLSPILSYVFFQPFTHPSILSIFPSTSPSLSTKASFFTFISVFRGF